jgi:hypothetical protein
MPRTELLEPEYSLQLAERNVASEYGSIARLGLLSDDDAVRVVIQSAVILELMVLGVCVYEALHDEGVTTVEDAMRKGIDLARSAEDRCGLAVEDLANDVIHYLPIQVLESDMRLESISVPLLVRMLRSSLGLCPIRDIERIGVAHGQERWAHRARVAYDALRAFLLRNDPQSRQQLRLVGRKYSEGVLTVDEVATLLSLDAEDVGFFLDTHGYARSLDRVRLPDDEREQILNAARADRLRRGGRPMLAPDLVARDTIASERIEEVDARQWIPKTVQ